MAYDARHPSGLSTQLELKLIEALEHRVDRHEVRLDQHETILRESHQLARETHSNVIAVKQWQERAIATAVRFSDEDEKFVIWFGT